MKAVLAARPDRQITETMADYLAQISLPLRVSSVYSTRGHLRRADQARRRPHDQRPER